MKAKNFIYLIALPSPLRLALSWHGRYAITDVFMFLNTLSASTFYKILKIAPFSILHIILMLCQNVNTQIVLVAAEPLNSTTMD